MRTALAILCILVIAIAVIPVVLVEIAGLAAGATTVAPSCDSAAQLPQRPALLAVSPFRAPPSL
jgi:hypothetical protein